MAALSVVVRTKRFAALARAPERPVLDRVRLELAPAETVAIIGPSGCGKTTLLNLIAGLDRDFEGEVRTAEGTRLAYVFQEPRLLPWRTVAQNLALVLEMVDRFEALPADTRGRVKDRVETLRARMDAEPKTLRWRARAAVGPRPPRRLPPGSRRVCHRAGACDTSLQNRRIVA